MSEMSRKPVAAMIEKLEERRLLSTVVALSARDLLTFFDSASPTDTISRMRVKGLERRESLLGVDFRPETGQLYGIGDSGNLYLIDATTGRATDITSNTDASLVLDPPLAGTAFGADFNPVADLFRGVSDLDQNVRVSPITGQVVDFDPGTVQTQTDLTLTYAPGDVNEGGNPQVVALAYTPEGDEDNDVGTADTTTVFGLDSITNTLVRLGSVAGTPESPNGGLLTTIGGLGVDIIDESGFDISTDSAGNVVGFATLGTDARARSGFYSIDLTTGAATLIGDVAGPNRPMRSMTVLPEGTDFVVLHANNRITTFDSNLPTIAVNQTSISGLARRERMLAIDSRPADGVVYGVTNQMRVYSINLTTGAAVAVGTTVTDDIQLNRKSSGAGFDFNPVTDIGRLVNVASENVRFDPTTGLIVDFDPVLAGTQLDGPLVYASTDANAGANPRVSGVAYSNNTVGATESNAYVIDTRANVLATIGAAVEGITGPDTGRLLTVGSLNQVAREPVAFDIVTDDADNNVGFAVFRARGVSNRPGLFRIDLDTGAATFIGQLPRGVNPVSLTAVVEPPVTVPPPPPPPTDG